jgi:hypothetical protein
MKAALMGRMSRICVYCSSCRAKANREPRALHHRTTEIATRETNVKSGTDLSIGPLFGTLATICSRSGFDFYAPFTVTLLSGVITVVRNLGS